MPDDVTFDDPAPVPQLYIPAVHEAYRKEFMPELEPEAFLKHVCRNRIALPQDGIPAHLVHVPITALSDTRVWEFSEEVSVTEGIEAPQGWRKRKILLVLPGPDLCDIAANTPLSTGSPDGTFLRAELEKAGIKNSDVLVSYVCRFAKTEAMTSYSQKHKTACLPYLLADIAACTPDIVVCCGADPLKAIMGKDAKLDTYRGSVIPMTLGTHSFQLIPTVTPAMFRTEYADITVFRRELSRVRELMDSTFLAVRPVCDYRVCRTVDEVKTLISDIVEANPRHLAFDTEFGNDVGRDEYRYTMSIQVSWGPGLAAFIQLRQQTPRPRYWRVTFGQKPKKDGTLTPRMKLVDPGPLCGVPMHTPEDEAAIWQMVSDLFRNPKYRLDAHHLRTDIEQFARQGDAYNIDSRIADGFDTMLVHHLLCGDDSQGLDHLVRKYRPGYGAYWQHLEQWLSDNGREGQLRFGYRNIPLDLLIPYALDDAAVTWLIAEDLEAELEQHPVLKKLYWNHVSLTSLHLLDVQRHGIRVDEQRRMELREFYKPIYDDYLKEIRDLINWPEFKPTSDDNVASLLYSQAMYRGKKDAPATARVLSLAPILTTDKYPKPWSDIVDQGKEAYYAPSTKVTTIELLHQQFPDCYELQLLRYLSVVGKFLSSFLAPVVLNEFGVPEGGAGFHCNIWNNGRVHTNFGQLSQTGRYTSFNTNLQVSPKKQETPLLEAVVWHRFRISIGDYKRRTFDGVFDKKTGVWKKPAYAGEDRIPPELRIDVPAFKTIFIPDEGKVFIEVDFKNAEIFVLAYCSGDPELIAIVDSGRDLHSEVACDAFKLSPGQDLTRVLEALGQGDLGPYNTWNKSFKEAYEAQRVAAKTVNFG